MVFYRPQFQDISAESEKLIGLTLWLTQLGRYMRIWIRPWYHDLSFIPAPHYSIDKGDWRKIFNTSGRQLEDHFSTSWYSLPFERPFTGGTAAYSLEQTGLLKSPSVARKDLASDSGSGLYHMQIFPHHA